MTSTPITTFVFFDIETTGLPWQEKNQTKVIEYCFLAVHRQDILRAPAGQTPLSCKLSCVVNPQRKIQPEVVKLTGLSNNLLAHAPSFHQQVETISTFLANLPKPVCLVAHNGNTFDFKILLAEFNDASTSLRTDLLCLDSLAGFRTLLKGTAINHATLSAENDVDKLQNLDNHSCDDSEIMTDDDEGEWADLDVSNEDWKDIDEICFSLTDISSEDISEANLIEENKLKNARRDAVKKVFDKGPRQDKYTKKAADKNSKVAKCEKQSFTLTSLYKRLINKEMNAHRAEADCIMLLECVVAMRREFLDWADNKCKLLSLIKALR